MVVDDSIAQALNRIADGLEENNDVLKRIANHYDGVVPVMTRNANRVEKAHEELEDNRSDLDKSWGIGLSNIMKPQNS
tara:strand:+ start:37 stop:270 length:234 start_codon:yes stop_codon:yes gene_type:complete